MGKYKCHQCKIVISEEDLVDGNCPVCMSDTALKPMCPRDHLHCSHDVVDGIAYCPDCGSQMCPVCGSHDVVQISRVTGYLQEVAGWNAGKQQELKDRARTNIT